MRSCTVSFSGLRVDTAQRDGIISLTTHSYFPTEWNSTPWPPPDWVVEWADSWGWVTCSRHTVYRVHPSHCVCVCVCVCVCGGGGGSLNVNTLGVPCISKNQDLLLLLLPSESSLSCYYIWLRTRQLIGWQPNFLLRLLPNLNTVAFTVWIMFSSAEQMFHRRAKPFQLAAGHFSVFSSHNVIEHPQLPLYSSSFCGVKGSQMLTRRHVTAILSMKG